ncbi:Eco57I restriction-modification methylase domain-containing protein [[Eubacterium] tenue]|nr:Eco57I restriction-modification methylase domain-containing protein [[Eubacterium] tenue]MBC8630941.1 Eco57I restriction-modification methylase domain-containing protein [[Eubacterium] tenue]
MEISSNNYYLSSLYENSLTEENKKSLGIYYTPKYIIDYIVKKTLYNHDFMKNPYPKILDLSCGCGNFLLEVYDILYEIFESYKYELKIEDIHNHIVSNCIYGIDIDSNAIKVLKYSLINKSPEENIDKFNIYCFDSLNSEGIDINIKKLFWDSKFDYIIGNPPYIGHKNLNKNYKKWLLKEYSQVYRDKSDIYFCFYKRIIDLLKEDGIASIITPRYFIESQSGNLLRKYILKNVSIEEIIDFNGVNVFKSASIASCIFTMRKGINENNTVDIYRLNNYSIDFDFIEDINIELKNEDEFEKINLNQRDMKDDWIIDKKENVYLYNKIENYCNYKLKDICVSFQGIITGCDKAFVIDNEYEENFCIEKNILKNWIKSKNIQKYFIEKNSLKLIYSDDIDDCQKYSNSIKYIKNYKQKLENRRECKKNIRTWYQLQWGRDKKIFERKKIMYPYKSKENRFAIDDKNRFCSADVYSFYIKDEYIKEFSYEYIAGLLNSSVYDTYFKTFGKKMGKNLYDYYPNKVMQIGIFKDHNYKSIEKLSKKIINILKSDNKLNKEVIILQDEINELIKDSLNINSLL